MEEEVWHLNADLHVLNHTKKAKGEGVLHSIQLAHHNLDKKPLFSSYSLESRMYDDG